jgi:hypothetical protein
METTAFFLNAGNFSPMDKTLLGICLIYFLTGKIEAICSSGGQSCYRCGVTPVGDATQTV